MIRKVKKILISLGLVFLFGMSLQCILLIRSFRLNLNEKKFIVTAKPTDSHDASRTPSNITRKEFIYLVQTESCLPAYLAGPELLGNASACRCDVIVLSFKTECEETINMSHVQYIYAPNTTWASGRNLLYRHSRARKFDYRYYIFADDDIRLEYNALANNSTKKQPELRTFENFLLEIEPVVGFVDYLTHNPASMIRAMRQHCHNKPDQSLLPLVHFDPILNGFHRDAISHLLPYSEEFDSTCWWHSHRLVSIGIEVKFRGQAVMYPRITVQNLSHRKYPTNSTGDEKIMRDVIERERVRVPQQYQNHFTLIFYRIQPFYYAIGFSPTTCMDIVPHRPIIPYAHFQEFPMHYYNSMDIFFNTKTLIPVIEKWLRHE